MRVKRRRRQAAAPREAPALPTGPMQRWSMDFVSDNTAEGFRFRVLTLVDNFTRKVPGLLVERSIGGHRVVRFLEQIAIVNGYPKVIVIDNGPEFISNALDQGACARRPASLHSPRSPCRERIHRELQRPLQGRMPQRSSTECTRRA